MTQTTEQITDCENKMHKSNQRVILADYDDQGIYVYQAFSDFTGNNALKDGAFVHGKGFNRNRMTWIKPSLSWALYRSGYARKYRQTVLLRIKVSHVGFLEILNACLLSEFEENHYHPSKTEWQKLKANLPGRVQWDPSRAFDLSRLESRSIQIGLGGILVNKYAEEWVLSIEDATPLAHLIQNSIEQNVDLPVVPEEREYHIPEAIAVRLGMNK